MTQGTRSRLLLALLGAAALTLVAVFVPAPSQAAVGSWHQHYEACGADSGGYTCSGRDSQGTVVAVDNQDYVMISNSSDWGNGSDATPTPGNWTSQSWERDVGVSTGAGSANATVWYSSLIAVQTAHGHNQTTNDTEAGATLVAPQIGTLPPVTIEHRHIMGTYDHCLIVVGATTVLDEVCGPDSFDELPLP
ncbi:MAG: hypothetical protein ACYDDF_01790 [Thermoplasmatota archaeon]